MNSKLVTIGVVAALAAVMVGIGVGTNNAFASSNHFNIPIQAGFNSCSHAQINGCSVQQIQQSHHFIQTGNINVGDD